MASTAEFLFERTGLKGMMALVFAGQQSIWGLSYLFCRTLSDATVNRSYAASNLHIVGVRLSAF
jgi:hypothetical protein